MCHVSCELFVDSLSRVSAISGSPKTDPGIFFFPDRSGASLAVNDNNGSFISTLSMHLYNVRGQGAPLGGTHKVSWLLSVETLTVLRVPVSEPSFNVELL